MTNVVVNATIERASADDLEAVLELLNKVELPVDGVAEHIGEFLVARQDGELVGCVGQERYGDVTLLRSLAVAPNLQCCGLGKALTAQLLDEALSGGVRDVVLLTTTARDFFDRQFGFSEADRTEFDDALADSPEWHLPRCSSAVCMHLEFDS